SGWVVTTYSPSAATRAASAVLRRNILIVAPPAEASRRSSFRLFDDQYLAAVHGDGDCRHQDEAENDLLGENRNPHEGHADAHDLYDESAHESAPDRADAAGNGGAADDDGRDRRQKEFAGQGWRARAQTRCHDNASNAGHGARQREAQDLGA